ncbi:hypothetical protein BHC46_00145 [Snodgrassella alvi]|jgi:hypothetical protein|uniref:Uncharacterized protein n=1 Tax=Snodgrassella alvi TaxID=1196083 RepID=A0A2N9XQ79_9NEIS|nr:MULTISPECIES: hypothetical protein [Snodgrassella]PIT08884.1 hypothetical protein BGI31_06050 [Snodgrassella communis]PIT50484.1 hypothetical protein BHC46_00145 [Snodgrassella alvi]
MFAELILSASGENHKKAIVPTKAHKAWAVQLQESNHLIVSTTITSESSDAETIENVSALSPYSLSIEKLPPQTYLFFYKKTA